MFKIVDNEPRQIGALDRALASLDWPVQAAQRELLTPGERVAWMHDSAGFSYISVGTAALQVGLERTELSTGDLIIYPRAHRAEIRATHESNIINAWFLPSGGSAHTLGTFPNTLLVREFSVREPNMAMLIEGMLSGQANASDFSRAGDSVVCSLISTTIVSAAILSPAMSMGPS